MSFLDFDIGEEGRVQTELLRVTGGPKMMSLISGELAGWLPDSRHLLIWNPNDATVSTVTAEGRTVAQYGYPTVSFIQAHFSPDGSRFAALGRDRNGNGYVFISPTVRPIQQELPVPDAPIESFVWAGDGGLFLMGKGATPPVWRVNLKTTQWLEVPLPNIPRRCLAASSNGKEVAFLERYGANDSRVVLYDTERGGRRMLSHPRGPYCELEWQPHGDWLMVKEGDEQMDTGLATFFIRSEGTGWRGCNVPMDGAGHVGSWLPDGSGYYVGDGGPEAADWDSRPVKNNLPDIATWSIDGQHALLIENNDVWLVSGPVSTPDADRWRRVQRVTFTGDRCFRNAVISATLNVQGR